MFIKRVKRRIGYEIKRTARFFGYEIFSKKAGYNYIPSIYKGNARRLMDIRHMHPFGQLAKETIDEGRTLLSYDRMHIIYQAIENAAKTTAGTMALAEVGVYKGGMSKFMIQSALQLYGKAEMYSIDTFSGHDAHDITAIDSEMHHAGKFSDSPYDDVCGYLSGLPAHVIKGRIEDVSNQLSDRKFHIAHIDTDLYGATTYSLKFFGERLHPHGFIIVDDAMSHSCPGVKKAIDEYLNTNKNMRGFFLLTNQCLVLRAP